MYFGYRDVRAVAPMLFELLELPVNAALGGKCSYISITLKPNYIFSIEDNSNGFPVDTDQRWDKSKLEMLFTKLAHYDIRQGLYCLLVSGGSHGVGPAAVNA